MTTPHPEKRHLASRTAGEVAAAAPLVLLVPVGSCEQHGPHLPLDTDTRVAVAVAERVAARRAEVVVAPAVAYGSSGEHQGFAGTLSIGTAALRTVLIELGRSAFPAAGAGAFASLVFVNGHGGNHEALGEAVDVLVGEGRPVTAWWPSIPGGDAHAGRTETSLLLAIAGDVVGPDRPVGETRPLGELLGSLRSGGVAAVAPNGVLGDATGASPEEGEALLAALVDDLAARLPVS
ncbi:mycofactocin biosynthesis peptidyl-dipeptidase MftE [Acidimicrobiia bacterium EGI L10123]|uniref:mycofactocin biosynthesis peptidyl-dipeptidase MftE n=1 Tax=Salinilacustrithrix flava TaxID=2957203 RepID=UPI003D7C19A3|nr:mycofactocin biosynthesis peptidyl-dipeptidase MftE [Acidimicrobiia bacterium EGI L10123]